MTKLLTPDICVIGGGPAGFAVASLAARNNVPVVLIEGGPAGGANLKTGAIPSKALIFAARQYELLRRGPALGVSGAPIQVNFPRLAEHIRSVADAVAPHATAERLAALGVRVINAPGRFLDRRTVIAGDFTVIARRFVLATGAGPAHPRIPGLDGIDRMTIEDAFDFARKPAHLVIIGADGHALELAQAYNRLGMDSTVVDTAPALPGEDPELASVVLNRLRAEGIRIRDGVAISSVARRRGGIRLTLQGPDGEAVIDGSHILVATGRRPKVDGLGLDVAGVAHKEDGIVVDGYLRTTNRRIFAIGDAIAGPAMVSRAEYEAATILKEILYRIPRRPRLAMVPVVIHTDPALARIGLGEAAAREADPAVRVLRFPFVENDLAETERRPEGLIKVVTDARGHILGAGIVGHEAGEQIALWSLAIAGRLKIDAFIGFLPPYPSRAGLSRRVAETFRGPGLTPAWQRRIIDFLRKFG